MTVVFGIAASTGVVLGEPPRVVSITPEHGASGVPVDTAEIRVVFDQDMHTGGYSWCGGGPQYPEVPAAPRWEDGRTCVLPVRLMAERDYALSINCGGARNFKSLQGEAAEVYPLNFTTRVLPAIDREEAERAAAELRGAIAERYSHRALRGIDWDALFAEHAGELASSNDGYQLGLRVARLLASAQDPHISVLLGEVSFPVYAREVRPNFHGGALERSVPGLRKRSNAVFTGRFEDGIGYILITTWGNSVAPAIEEAHAALREFEDLPALIVDVRPNGGGDDQLARRFAARFIHEQRTYAFTDSVDPDVEGGFGPRVIRRIAPARDGPRFAGPVAVLMGPQCMSSNESFLLMMRQCRRAVLIGKPSYGSSGNPRPVEIGAGVTVLLPTWREYTAEGEGIEGRGVGPDVLVEADPPDGRGGDPVVARALEVLREKIGANSAP